MTISIKTSGDSPLFEVTSGYSITEQSTRLVTRISVPMTGKVFAQDMVTREISISLTTPVYTDNSSYGSRSAMVTAIRSTQPSSASTLKLVDSEGIYDYDNMLVEDYTITDTPDDPNGVSVSFKIIIFDTNFTAP